MAVSQASATAEVASATAGMCFTAEMIRAHSASSQTQPYERSNEALKRFRDTMEIGFEPTALEKDFDLQPPTISVRKCTHGRGEEFHFEQGALALPWSWSQMLLATGSRFDEVVGEGVVAVKLFARPDSYDHMRAAAYIKQTGQTPTTTPRIWDFLVMRADGTGVLLHPSWKKHGALKFLPFHDMQHAVSPVPRSGLGMSDGKGTFRRTTSAAYTSRAKEPPPAVPATAGPSPVVEPSDTGLPQMPPMPQRVPPGASAAAAAQRADPPPPPPAPAIAGEAQGSSSQSASRKMPPPPPPEVPPTAGGAVASDGPVLPPSSAEPTTVGDIDALSASSWYEIPEF